MSLLESSSFIFFLHRLLVLDDAAASPSFFLTLSFSVVPLFASSKAELYGGSDRVAASAEGAGWMKVVGGRAERGTVR